MLPNNLRLRLSFIITLALLFPFLNFYHTLDQANILTFSTMYNQVGVVRYDSSLNNSNSLTVHTQQKNEQPQLKQQLLTNSAIETETRIPLSVPLSQVTSDSTLNTTLFDNIKSSTLATTTAAKSDGRWVSVPIAERYVYDSSCNNPFKHCCIGQGRIIYHSRNDTESLYKKWLTVPPLSGLIDVINYLSDQKKYTRSSNDRNTANINANQTKVIDTSESSSLLEKDNCSNNSSSENENNNDTCNIWMIGDSLTSDHVVAAMCDLTGRHGYEIIDCAGKFGEDGFWAENHFCERYSNNTTEINSIVRSVKRDYPHFLLRKTIDAAFDGTTTNNSVPKSTSSSSSSSSKHNLCSQVLIRLSAFERHNSPIKGLYNVSEDFVNQGGIVMWNHGVHCNDANCVTKFINAYVEPFITWLWSNTTQYYKYESDKNNKNNKWYLMWRETEPQHFRTVDGLYELGARQMQCMDAVTTTANNGSKTNDLPLNNFRNDEARVALQKLQHDTQIPIPIIPIFDALVSRPDFHIDRAGDCTHYVYTPWRFDLTWDGMLKGMKEIDSNMTKIKHR